MLGKYLILESNWVQVLRGKKLERTTQVWVFTFISFKELLWFGFRNLVVAGYEMR
jgi:hypothetical protein